MVLVSFLVFIFFGMHTILHAAIVNLPSKSSLDGSLKSKGWLMLGYAEDRAAVQLF